MGKAAASPRGLRPLGQGGVGSPTAAENDDEDDDVTNNPAVRNGRAPPEMTRPCQHNAWDDVRTRRHAKILQCRACLAKWKLQMPVPRCSYFLHGHCEKGDSCQMLHVYKKKADKANQPMSSSDPPLAPRNDYEEEPSQHQQFLASVKSAPGDMMNVEHGMKTWFPEEVGQFASTEGGPKYHIVLQEPKKAGDELRAELQDFKKKRNSQINTPVHELSMAIPTQGLQLSPYQNAIFPTMGMGGQIPSPVSSIGGQDPPPLMSPASIAPATPANHSNMCPPSPIGGTEQHPAPPTHHTHASHTRPPPPSINTSAGNMPQQVRADARSPLAVRRGFAPGIQTNAGYISNLPLQPGSTPHNVHSPSDMRKDSIPSLMATPLATPLGNSSPTAGQGGLISPCSDTRQAPTPQHYALFPQTNQPYSIPETQMAGPSQDYNSMEHQRMLAMASGFALSSGATPAMYQHSQTHSVPHSPSLISPSNVLHQLSPSPSTPAAQGNLTSPTVPLTSQSTLPQTFMAPPPISTECLSPTSNQSGSQVVSPVVKENEGVHAMTEDELDAHIRKWEHCRGSTPANRNQ
eukprot:gene12263-18948_t